MTILNLKFYIYNNSIFGKAQKDWYLQGKIIFHALQNIELQLYVIYFLLLNASDKVENI